MSGIGGRAPLGGSHRGRRGESVGYGVCSSFSERVSPRFVARE